MKKIILAALLALSIGCTDEDRSRQVLTGAGYKNISTTGYRWMGCDDNDSVHTGFTAVGPTGQKVEGVVCCGSYLVPSWGKGCTIRF